MNARKLSGLFLPLLFFALVIPANADVKLASIFGDSMVIQQEMAAPVWGWAEAGEKVTVKFGDQSKSTEAGKDGKWQVNLDALKANAKGQSLTVTGNNTVEVKDVLVGEVWICSGQSNMEWRLGNALNPKEEIEASDHPQIRLFDVPGHTTSPVANDTCPGSWKVCSPA
ncbi:MAG: sialate O-acetylesterase, partial [Pirellulaceae bacterium]